MFVVVKLIANSSCWSFSHLKYVTLKLNLSNNFVLFASLHQHSLVVWVGTPLTLLFYLDSFINLTFNFLYNLFLFPCLIKVICFIIRKISISIQWTKKISCSVLCTLIHTNRTLDSQLSWYPKTYWVASEDKVANQI